MAGDKMVAVADSPSEDHDCPPVLQVRLLGRFSIATGNGSTGPGRARAPGGSASWSLSARGGG